MNKDTSVSRAKHVYPSKKCVICRRKQIKGNNLHLHRLPLDPSRCLLWVKAIADEDLAYVPIEKLHVKYVCHHHFAPKDYRPNKNILKKTAVPTLNLQQKVLPEEVFKDFPYHINPDYINKFKRTETKYEASIEDTWQSQKEVSDASSTSSIFDKEKDEELNSSAEEEEALEAAISDAENGDELETADKNANKGGEAVWREPKIITCNECGSEKDGKLFQCVECPQVVCVDCEHANRHWQHCMLRLPSRRVYDKLRKLFESIHDAVTACLAAEDYDPDLEPKDEPIDPDPLNTSLIEDSIQPITESVTNVKTDNRKRIIVKAQTLVPSELISGPAKSVLNTVPEPKCVLKPISVPGPKSVLPGKSASAAKTIPKRILIPGRKFELKTMPVLKPVSFPVEKSVRGPNILIVQSVTAGNKPKPIYLPTKSRFPVNKTVPKVKCILEAKTVPQGTSNVSKLLSKGVKILNHNHNFRPVSTITAKKEFHETTRPIKVAKELQDTAKRKKTHEKDVDENFTDIEYLSETEKDDEFW